MKGQGGGRGYGGRGRKDEGGMGEKGREQG